MRKALLMPILFGLICLYSYGQDDSSKTYSFKDETYSFDFNEKPADLEEHELGEKVALKMHFLQKTYTYKEKGTSTSPTDKTIVLKPTIYYSIKKLNNSYRKGIKKGEISLEEASKNMDKCLYVALAIFYQDTEDFERDLRKLKSPEEIVSFYENVKFVK